MINQFLFLNALNHYGVGEINIVLPYFPVGTMERIVGEGEIPTAYSLAHLLNSIPEGAAKNNLYIFDIHALCSRFFFHTNTRPILLTIMPEYLKHIKESYSEKSKALVVEVGVESPPQNYNLIVFPDDGAAKRFGKMIPSDFKTITCTKVRDGEKRFIKIDQDGLKHFNPLVTVNKIINLFVIDDLVQSGGTLLETFDGLKTELSKPEYKIIPANIRYIAMVTHSVFPKESDVTNFFTRTKANSAYIHKLITTNSRPFRSKYIQDNFGDRITVLNLSNSLKAVFSDVENKEYYGRFSIKD
jgi:phosphoribosylpyrophosphate synthetase